MRFIIFNIIVGAGLIYLFNGGQLPLDQMKHGLKQVQAQVKKAATIKPINDAELSQKRDKENNERESAFVKAADGSKIRVCAARV